MPAYMRQFIRLRDAAGEGEGEGSGAGEGNATPTTPFGSFYGESGLNREALETLPESAAPIRSMLEKYPNEDALYGGIKNLQYLASQKSLAKLPADATDEQKHQHNTMVKEYFGVPDHAKDYGVAKPDGIPDEMWDAEGTDALLDILHQHNASPELVQALAAHQIAGIQGELDKAPQREEDRRAEVNAELTKSFGNELQTVSAEAAKGLAALGIDMPESGNIADLKIGYTEILKAGQRMTQLIGEDAVSRGLARDSSQNSAGSYRDQAMAIKTDPSNRFYADFTSEDPARQKVAQKEFNRLLEMAETHERK